MHRDIHGKSPEHFCRKILARRPKATRLPSRFFGQQHQPSGSLRHADYWRLQQDCRGRHLWHCFFRPASTHGLRREQNQTRHRESHGAEHECHAEMPSVWATSSQVFAKIVESDLSSRASRFARCFFHNGSRKRGSKLAAFRTRAKSRDRAHKYCGWRTNPLPRSLRKRWIPDGQRGPNAAAPFRSRVPSERPLEERQVRGRTTQAEGRRSERSVADCNCRSELHSRKISSRQSAHGTVRRVARSRVQLGFGLRRAP